MHVSAQQLHDSMFLLEVRLRVTTAYANLV